MKRIFCLLLVSICAHGQVSEEMKVVLRDIRVHVLDENGDPVRGLKREDFHVRENKVERDITFFEEVSQVDDTVKLVGSEAISADGDERYLVMVIDSSNMDREAFDATIEQVKHYVAEELSPLDRVKIAQIEERLVVLSDFSSNPDTLIDALSRVRYKGVMRKQLEYHENDILTTLEFFENTARASKILGTSSPFGGQEVTADIEMAADRVVDAIHAKESSKARHFETYYQNMMVLAKALGAIKGSKTILLFTGGFYLQSHGHHRSTTGLSFKVAQVLNAANTTVYTFLAGTVDPVGTKHRRSGAFFSIGDSEILLRLEPWVSDPKTVRKLRTGTGNTLFENTHHLESGPFHQAELTGGFFHRALTPKAVEEKFSAFTNACRHYYRLGFDSMEQEKKTKVVVKLAGDHKKWKLHYGEHMIDSADEDDQSEPASAEMALLYDTSERNDLNCTWHYEIFPLGDGRFAIPTQILWDIPAKSETEYRIGFAVLNQHGEPLDVVFSKVRKITAKGKAYLHDVLIAEEVPKVIRFYMRDMDSKDLSLHQETVPEPEILRSATLYPVSFCVARARVLPMNELRQDQIRHDSSANRRVDLDPFRWGEQKIMPNPFSVFEKGRAFHVVFWVSEVPDDFDPAAVAFFGMGEEGRRPLKGQIIDSRSFGSGRLVLAKIDDQDMKAGTHEFRIEVQIPGQAGVKTGQRPLSILLPGGYLSVTDLNNQLLFRSGDPNSSRKDLEELIRLGANIETRDDNQNGALIFAVQNGNQEILSTLIDLGADVNAENNVGMTPLMLACQLGSLEAVEKLANHGSDVNKADQYGNTAMHYAASFDRGDAIKMLLASGADPHIVNGFGHTPGYVAAARGYLSVLMEMEAVQVDFNGKDGEGKTVLHHLVSSPSEALVTFLVDHGANLEIVDSEGNTPLLYAALHGFDQGVAVFAKLDGNVNHKNQAGVSPLLAAAMNGNPDVVRILMAYEADTKATLQGLNALILAAVNGHADVVKYLIACKMDPSFKCPRGYTALDYAKQANRSDVVSVLEGEEKEFDWWDE